MPPSVSNLSKLAIDATRVLQSEAWIPEKATPVIYWMQREFRLRDNHALYHAIKIASEQKQPLLRRPQQNQRHGHRAGSGAGRRRPAAFL